MRADQRKELKEVFNQFLEENFVSGLWTQLTTEYQGFCVPPLTLNKFMNSVHPRKWVIASFPWGADHVNGHAFWESLEGEWLKILDDLGYGEEKK